MIVQVTGRFITQYDVEGYASIPVQLYSKKTKFEIEEALLESRLDNLVYEITFGIICKASAWLDDDIDARMNVVKSVFDVTS